MAEGAPGDFLSLRVTARGEGNAPTDRAYLNEKGGGHHDARLNTASPEARNPGVATGRGTHHVSLRQRERQAMQLTLQSPVIITSRLLPGLQIGDGTISIEYAGGTDDNRQRYRYYVDLRDGTEVIGDDLCSPVGGGTLQDGLEALLGFLSAYAEMAEDWNQLGPLGPWATENRDEFASIESYLQEHPGLIVEG